MGVGGVWVGGVGSEGGGVGGGPPLTMWLATQPGRVIRDCRGPGASLGIWPGASGGGVVGADGSGASHVALAVEGVAHDASSGGVEACASVNCAAADCVEEVSTDTLRKDTAAIHDRVWLKHALHLF